MGKNKPTTEAKVTIVDNKKFVNKNTVELVNQNISENIANTIMKTASSCGSSATADNIIDLTNLKFGDNAIIDLDQSQKINVSFECTNESKLRNDIANELFKQMMASIKDSNNTEILSQLEATAATNSTSGFLNTNFGDTKSDTDTKINYEVTNENYINLQNIIQNRIENNFTSDDIKECIAKIGGTNQVVVDTLTAGNNAVFKVNQSQMFDSLAKCSNFTDAANNITSQIMTALDIDSTTESETKAQTSVKSSAETVAENRGPFESIGVGIGSVLGGVGNMFGGLFGGIFGGLGSGMMAPLSSFCLCLSFCLIIIVVIVILIFFVFSGNEEGTSLQSTPSVGPSRTASLINSKIPKIPKTNLTKILNI